MPKCDSCPKKATVYVQQMWVKCPIVKGIYGELKVVDDFSQDPSAKQDTLHLCDGHYQMWVNGNL